MSMQVVDKVTYKDQDWGLLASSQKLFQPEAYNLELSLQFINSACLRNHLCSYAVVDNELILNEVFLTDHDAPPAINGVVPTTKPNKLGFTWSYDQLNVKSDLTGSLLIGQFWQENASNYSYYREPWNYKESLRLQFYNGELLHEVSLTLISEDYREQVGCFLLECRR